MKPAKYTQDVYVLAFSVSAFSVYEAYMHDESLLAAQQRLTYFNTRYLSAQDILYTLKAILGVLYGTGIRDLETFRTLHVDLYRMLALYAKCAEHCILCHTFDGTPVDNDVRSLQRLFSANYFILSKLCGKAVELYGPNIVHRVGWLNVKNMEFKQERR